MMMSRFGSVRSLASGARAVKVGWPVWYQKATLEKSSCRSFQLWTLPSAFSSDEIQPQCSMVKRIDF